jgi:hypothetical protein
MEDVVGDCGTSGEQWREKVVIYWDGGSGAASTNNKVAKVSLHLLLFSLSLRSVL